MHPGGGARARRRVVRPVSEINVTPLIDVMLVLLVVFMVTAPMMTVGVPVDLPKAGAPPLQGQDEPLVVTVNARHEIFIQETRVTEEEMVPRLMAIARQNKDLRIFVRGDQTLPYGEMMRIMGCLYSGGFLKVALVTHGQSQPAGKRPGT
jgi:biopolymer transport protein TolR